LHPAAKRNKPKATRFPRGLLRGGREHLTDAPDLVALQGSQGEKLKPMAQAVAISD
jgi:hypothetical protein